MVPATPLRLATQRFRLFPFRSPLLGKSMTFFPFLRVLRCFSSPRCPRRPMNSADASIRLRMDGFPIRRFPGQGLFDSYPRLIAAFRVLLRLLAPRHPPYALSSLTAILIADGPERRRREELRALSSRLKIKRVCATSHYSVVKDPLASHRGEAVSSIRAAFDSPVRLRGTKPADAGRWPLCGGRHRNRGTSGRELVETSGLEPPTSGLQSRRSPS